MKKMCFFLKPRLLFVFMYLVLLPCCVIAQQYIVKGKITDSTGTGLEKVSVRIKGRSTGTATAADGTFSITAPSSNAMLIISNVGYVSQEIPVSSPALAGITLVRDNEILSDIVVVGYTQQTKANTTAAISKLNPEELRNTSNPNPLQALQGKIAGVSVPITAGQPGAGATNIIIRGGTKLNVYGSGLGNNNGSSTGASDASSPLVVVDGVFRSLNDINPDNIESFQVMKDAASTAIYGARGANGVIVIKTKGGKFNSKMNISLNHRTTWETQAGDYRYLSAEQYLQLARTTVKNTFDGIDKTNLLNNGGFSAGTRVYSAKGQYGNNIYLTALYDNIVAIEGQPYVDGLLARGWQVMDDPINPGTRLLYADNHYQDMIWETGLSQNENLAINGGSDKSNYNVSMATPTRPGFLPEPNTNGMTPWEILDLKLLKISGSM